MAGTQVWVLCGVVCVHSENRPLILFTGHCPDEFIAIDNEIVHQSIFINRSIIDDDAPWFFVDYSGIFFSDLEYFHGVFLLWVERGGMEYPSWLCVNTIIQYRYIVNELTKPKKSLKYALITYEAPERVFLNTKNYGNKTIHQRNTSRNETCHMANF